MGKWHRIANKYQCDYLDLYREFAPLKAECETLRIEAAHHRAEAEKSVGYAKRERERGDNLQREVQGLEAEVAGLQSRTPLSAEHVLRLERDNKALIEANLVYKAQREDDVQEILRLERDWQKAYNEAFVKVGVPTQAAQGVPVVRSQIVSVPTLPTRRKLPDSRRSLTIKLRINRGQQLCPECASPLAGSQTSLHLMLGFFDGDGMTPGALGEVFVKMDRARRGSAAATFADEYAKAVSFILQHGLPITWVVEKARHIRDESAGVPFVWADGEYRPHPVLKHVGSTVDYIAAVLERVLAGKPADQATPEEEAEMAKKLAEAAAEAEATP